MTRSQRRYAELQESKAAEAPSCGCGCGQKVLWDLYRHVYKTHLFGHFQARAKTGLTERQRQLVRGTLLGDCYANFVTNRRTGERVNARLRIRHSTKRQHELVRWKRRELDSICSGEIRVRPTPKAYGKEIAEFNTLSHHDILGIASPLYSPVKTVNRAYLDTLDDFGLAVWYMDDGAYATISTHSFSDPEQDLIVAYLAERWGVESEVATDKKRGLKFVHLNHPLQLHRVIARHVIPELYYKFQFSYKHLLRDGLLKLQSDESTVNCVPHLEHS